MFPADFYGPKQHKVAKNKTNINLFSQILSWVRNLLNSSDHFKGRKEMRQWKLKALVTSVLLMLDHKMFIRYANKRRHLRWMGDLNCVINNLANNIAFRLHPILDTLICWLQVTLPLEWISPKVKLKSDWSSPIYRMKKLI